jgi:hypothetical protein
VLTGYSKGSALLRWSQESRGRRPRLQRKPRPARGYSNAVIGIADAHRDDGKRIVVCSDEKLTAFLELARVTKKKL